MAESKIIGFGHPIVDYIFDEKEGFLDDLKIPIGSYRTFERKDDEVFDKIHKSLLFKGKFPGDATLNTLRIIQAFNQNKIKEYTGYVGCVGNDETATFLEKTLNETGIVYSFVRDPTLPTGKCFVIVTGKERTMLTVTKSAFQRYGLPHILKDIESGWFQNARIVFSTAFFLYDCFNLQALLEGVQHCNKNSIVFSLSLSAPNIIRSVPERFFEILPSVSILFGNREEYLAMGEILGLDPSESLANIGKYIAEMPKITKDISRIVLITQGPENVILVNNSQTNGTEIKSYPAMMVDDEKIVDTTGAGDAFAGGFLYGYDQGYDQDKCVEAGLLAAKIAIQRQGFTLDSLAHEEISSFYS